MEHEVYISREVIGLGHNESAGLIKKAVNMALDAEGIDVPCIISIMLTDDEGIQTVNREFRGHDLDTGAVLLGDMMISIPRCEEQGAEFGHGYKREIMYLTVHSVLHLLGYDHVDEGEMKAQMRAREKAIMGDD